VERKKAVIEYGDVKIVLREATAMDGMRRMVLLQSIKLPAEEEEEASGDRLTDLLTQALLRRSYACCISCVEAIEGMETPSFEEFGNLPETLVTQWENAALELNPHWKWWTEEELTEEEQEAKKENEPAASENSTADS